VLDRLNEVAVRWQTADKAAASATREAPANTPGSSPTVVTVAAARAAVG
jgi:hypothetical protein